MNYDRQFRFADDSLNRELLTGLAGRGVPHVVAEDRCVYYHSRDGSAFEDVLNRVRCGAFPDWQVLSCPADFVDRYRAELARRGVACREELSDGSVEFLMAAEHDPHSWPLVSVDSGGGWRRLLCLAVGHDWVSIDVDYDDVGRRTRSTRTCSFCGRVETRSWPAT